MAFVQFKLDKKTNQSRDIFDIFIYKTEDTLAAVGASGYFSKSRFASNGSTPDEGWNGGKIEVKTSDGYAEGFVDDATGTWTAEISS